MNSELQNLFNAVAQKNGVSPAEVEKEIYDAIQYAFDSGSLQGFLEKYQEEFATDGRIPTPEEIILFSIHKAGAEFEGK